MSDLASPAMISEAVGAASSAPFEFDRELRERNFGDPRGQSYASPGFDPYAGGHAPPTPVLARGHNSSRSVLEDEPIRATLIDCVAHREDAGVHDSGET